MKKKLRFKGFFKSILILAVLCFSQIGLGQVSITSLPFNKIDDFNTYNPSNSTNANSTLPNGWTFSASASVTYRGRTASPSLNQSGCYALGTSPDFSIGAYRSGSVIYTYAVNFTNNSGSAITSLTLSWDYEQWLFANTSGWNVTGTGQLASNVTLNSKDFIGSATGSVGAVTPVNSFTLTGLNIADGQSFGLSFQTTDASGGDNAISIDNFNISAAGAAPNSAPTASNVLISGTNEVGQTLTGSYTYNDTESNPQGTPIFKWYRADNAAGLNEMSIAGATSLSYALTIDDLNKFIRFSVVPVATEGTLTGAETFSGYTSAIGLGSSPNLTITGSLNEATLNNATVTLILANETFADAALDSSNFTLNNAPSGVSIASVNYIDPSSVSLILAYDNTDFDNNITDFNITISGVELTASNPLTSNNLNINAVVETLTVGVISSFGNQCVNLLSAEQSFTISGSNLKAGTITLAALSGFSYSETANGVYTSTLSFSNTAGTLTNKTIFVKFLPTAVQSYNGNIVVSSVGAPNVNRSVVGSGINTLPAITTPTSTSITDSSATLGGNITVVGCSSITERGIYYSLTSGFANGSGTKVSTFGTYSTGVFTIPVSGLSSNTVYYYKAFASSASGTVYTSQGTFATNVLPVNVPYFQDFEGATNDFVLDATGTNKWTIGTGTNNGGTKALYISNDNSSNAYTFNSIQNGTFASLQVDLSSIANATLSFDWRSNGEEFDGIVYDYGEVYVNAGSGDILVSNTNEFHNSSVFSNKQIDLSPFVGGVITVKFKWVNDNVAGNQPPFAVDNISILPYGLPVLSTATVNDITYNSAISGGTVTSDGGDLITARGIVYATTTNPTLSDNVINNGSDLGTFVSNLTGLNSNTTYYVRAFATNTNSTYYGNEESFTTPAIDAPVAISATSINDTSFIANWDAVSGADAYLLDVISGFENQTITETFSSIGGGTSSGYNDRTWIGTNGITWTAYNSRTDQVINSGNDAITLRDASNSYVESASIIGSLTSISFQIQQKFGGSGGSVALKILSGVGFSTSTTIGNYPFNTSIATINATISGITGPFKIVIENDGTTRPCIDNLTFDVSTVTYVAGFENFNVGNVLTHTVTGLETGTKYYYRVRAIDANSVSQNSNTIEVTTTGTVRWTGATNTNWSTASNWSNALVPDGTYDIEIPSGNPVLDTAYTVQTGSDLTISGTGTLTIAPTASLTVEGTTNFGGNLVTLQSDATGTATIGEVSGTLSNATNVTVERYIPAKRAWRLLTAPLKGTTNNTIADNWQGTTNEGLLLFSPATFQSQAMTGYATGGNAPNIYQYSAGWQIIPNLSTETIFGANATDTKAYQVFVTGAHGSSNIATGVQATTLRPSGELITGSVTHPLTANAYKLIANPYASPLNTEALVQANSGSKAWLLDPTVGFGAYVTYDGANWSITPSGNDVNIQSGQGFLVRSTGTFFEIQESHKTTGNSNTWFERNASSTADKIRVLLYKEINNEWQLADGILAVNSADGNTAVDNTDAGKVSNFNESMMFRNGISNLSIEYRALPQANEVQPIRLTGTSTASYELRLFTENYNNSSLVPMLEDTQTGTFTAIPTDGSIVSVPFTGVLSTGTNPDNRFKIVYQAALSNDMFNTLTVSVYPNPVNEGFLNINLLEAGKATYNLYNLVGQEVQNGILATQNSQVMLSSLQAGIYILSIDQAGKKYTTKVIVE